jgi:hypothetical protein
LVAGSLFEGFGEDACMCALVFGVVVERKEKWRGRGAVARRRWLALLGSRPGGWAIVSVSVRL